MKRIFNLLLVIVFLNACHPPQTKLVHFSEGASMANPVMVNETSHLKGIAYEYQWIKDHCRFCKTVRQRLVSAPHGKKVYDVITVELVDGQKMDIYFDINKFYNNIEL